MFQLIHEYPNKTRIITSEIDPKANMSNYETCVFYSDGSSSVLANFNNQIEAETYHQFVTKFITSLKEF